MLKSGPSLASWPENMPIKQKPPCPCSIPWCVHSRCIYPENMPKRIAPPSRIHPWQLGWFSSSKLILKPWHWKTWLLISVIIQTIYPLTSIKKPAGLSPSFSWKSAWKKPACCWKTQSLPLRWSPRCSATATPAISTKLSGNIMGYHHEILTPKDSDSCDFLIDILYPISSVRIWVKSQLVFQKTLFLQRRTMPHHLRRIVLKVTVLPVYLLNNRWDFCGIHSSCYPFVSSLFFISINP